MAIVDFFQRRPQPASDEVFAADSAPNDASLPDKPREDPPIGSSGRAHTHGFLHYEEENALLRHPQGHRIYDQMYRTDGDVKQVVQLVVNPILSGTWSCIPAGGQDATKKDQAVAEFVRWAVWEKMSPTLKGHLSEALPVLVRSGMSPFEITWMAVDYSPTDVSDDTSFTKGQRVVPRTLGLRLPRTIQQFEQDEFGQLTRIRQQLPISRSSLISVRGQEVVVDDFRDPNVANGYDTPSLVWIEKPNLLYYRIGGEGDNWEGTPMLRPAYKHWLMKDKIERIDAVAQEREGLGIPICYPPMGATPEQLDAVEAILDGMRSNEQGYIVAPGPKAGSGAPEGQGWLFDLIGYNRTGTGRDPQPSLKYHTDKIAAAFIAEFIRSGHITSRGGSSGQEVQLEPFLMSIEALVGALEDALAELVRQIVTYNFGPDVEPPRLTMSLVDSTSLSQLADYILKLCQVGALLPDQDLERWLRDRADLPPSDPEVVESDPKKDQDKRRELLTGGGEPGGGGGASQGMKPGFGNNQNQNKPIPKKSPGAGGGGGVGSNGLSADDDGTVILDGLPGGTPVSQRVELRPFEHEMCLDGLETCMDSMPDQMAVGASQSTYALARAMATGKHKAHHVKAVRDAIHGVLLDAYNYGAQTVHAEVAHQQRTMGKAPVGPVVLDKGARDRGVKHLADRADAAAERVHMEVKHALVGHDLAHGNTGQAQQAGERAGQSALRRAAFDHGIPAVQHGRHDTAVTLAAAGVPILGARYTAVLDKGTCGPCRKADDGQVRALDDPVRLENMPPNPHCDSLASGFNHCRCVEHYELMPGSDTTLDREDVPNDPLKTNWIEQRGGLPGFTADIAGDLITERGFDTSHAIATAENKVKEWAAGGDHVNAGTQAKAAEALAHMQAIERG